MKSVKIAKQEKKLILSITKTIIANEIPDELTIYEAFEESLYAVVLDKKGDIADGESHFGGEESITSYYILAVIAWVSNALANEGLKIAKITLYKWIKNNKKITNNKYRSEKYKKALLIIEKYLEKEINE